jgi:hypothetical protein
MMDARSRQHGMMGNPDTAQLLLIVSDGRGLFMAVACFKSWNKSSQTIYSRQHIFVTHSPKSGPGFPMSHIIAFFYVQ